jgi:hypothetical protein
MKAKSYVAVGLTLLFLLSNTRFCYGADFPTPSGKFTFEGKNYTGTAILENTLKTNKSLYLNGEYYSDKAYTALFAPVSFDYHRFTVVVKLRPYSLGAPLLVGGRSCRWLGLYSITNGSVELSFNNFEFRHSVEKLTITNGQWITLAVSVNLPSKKVVVYANGTPVDEVTLPRDFALDVTNDEKWKESDKHLTFTDYSHGEAYRGLVGGLLVFNSVLSDEQVRRLFPGL